MHPAITDLLAVAHSRLHTIQLLTASEAVIGSTTAFASRVRSAWTVTRPRLQSVATIPLDFPRVSRRVGSVYSLTPPVQVHPVR